jgi:signal recognition particle GTPase
MSNTLSEKLSRMVRQISGQARITESNVADMLREVRMALLEADVALPVVRDFIARVKERALGQEVVGSLTPGQVLVSIVQRELSATMGEGVSDINLAAQPPAVILMAGLQGAGKTTTTAKLARHLINKRKKKVLTVPPSRDRTAQKCDGASRCRMVSQRPKPTTGANRAGGIGLCTQPLCRCVVDRHRWTLGDR